MKTILRAVVFVVISIVTISAFAQQGKKLGILDGQELKQVTPTNYFFDDQLAPVQLRNSVAIRLKGDKMVLAGLVDNSGYSSDVAQKYQGFFITSKKISINGKDVAPGQYGFGFTKEGKFRLLDVGANDVFQLDSHQDEALKRPVPLKAVADGSNFRLYAGKKYVTIKAE